MEYQFESNLENLDKLDGFLRGGFPTFQGVSKSDGIIKLLFTEELSAEVLAEIQNTMSGFVDYTDQEYLIRFLLRTVDESNVIAKDIIQKFKAENLSYFVANQIPNEVAIFNSLWLHHRLRAVEINVGGIPFVIDVLNLVVSGDLETALVVLQYMTPDDMTAPYHFLSQERINRLVSMLAAALA